MSETIASGRIEVNLDDRSALAGLDRIEAEYERTMKRIDAMEAEAEVGIDKSEFDRDAAAVAATMKKLDGKEATIEVRARIDDLKGDLRKAEAVVKDYDARIAATENNRSKAALRAQQRKRAAEAAALKEQLDGEKERLAAIKRTNSLLEIEEQRIAAIQRREDKRAKAMAAEDRRRAAAEKARQGLMDKADRLMDKMETKREQIATRRAREEAQQRAALQREMDAVPKLQRRYVELAQTIDKLAEQRRKSRDDRAKVLYTAKIDEVIADRDQIGRRLKALDIDPVDVGIRLVPGNDFGTAMRDAINDGYRRGGIKRAAINTGLVIGTSMSAGIVGGIQRNLRPSKIGRGIGDWLIKAGNALGNLTVRIGPFTATIRQAIVGLSLLGPILVDIVGAAGALVGVLGSATVGLGALTMGFLGGAIPAALGMGLVIKDVAQEFTAAKKATKAYDDAVMKHGKSSDQAAKKLKELRNVMGNVSKTTAKQFVEGQKLGSAWDKLTKPAHASVWKLIGNSMEAAANIMPMFAKNTNEAMDAAEKGTSKWMKALSDPAGRKVLNTMMDNFTAALPNLMSGLGQLIGYFGKVGAAASQHLEPLAKTFNNWAKGINDTADDTEGLQQRVDKTIQSLKDVGRFFMAAGRLAKSFFGGGVGAGQSFVNTMTNAMNRWTAFLNTAEGQNKLGEFFREAVAGTQAFWSFLQPIITTFVRWATLISPIARGFFELAGAVAQATSAFLRLTGLQGPLAALLTTLGVLWGVSRIAGATRAVIGFTRALLGLAGAQKAVAASSAMGAAGAVAGGAVVARGAARGPGALVGGATAATGKVSKLASVGAKATRVMAGLSAATIGVANPLIGLGMVAAGAGFGIYKLMTRTRDHEKAQKSAEQSTKSYQSAVQAMGPVQNQLAQEYLNSKNAALQVKTAEAEVARLRKAGMTNTDEYTQAVLNLRQAELSLTQNKAALRAANEAETQTYRAMNREAKEALDARNRQVKNLGERNDTKELFASISEKAKDAGVSIKEMIDSTETLTTGQRERLQGYADSLDAQERAERRVRRAQELSTLASLNHQRSLRGISALAQNTAGHFSRLAKQSRSVATRIAVKFTDSGDAARVARSASATLKSGVPTKIVTKIVADSKNADDAVRRLQRVRLTPKRLEIIEEGGSRAIGMLERIIGRKLTRKELPIAEEGGPRVLAMLSRIIGRNLPTKRQNTTEQGGRAVLGILGNIAAFSLPNKTFTITERRVIATIHTSKGPQQRPTAKGKRGGAPGYNALIGEGGDDEWRVNRRTGEVYKTDGPQVVKLGSDDAIIPTEPKYKERGREIFKAVAKDLGLSMFAGGRNPKKKKAPAKKSGGGYSPFGGSFDAEGFKPKATVSRDKKFKPSKKNKKPYSARRGWAEYIEGLHTQQGYWEREVSIRESQVREPENMVIEIGKQNVVDPTTGEVTAVPVYAANPEIENSYKPALQSVLQAMSTLMSIIMELVRAIPQALAANKAESGYHQDAKENLDRQIRRQKNRVSGTKGKQRDKHERELDRLKERRDKHIEARKELKESEKTLLSDHVEAGFDQREAAIAQANLQREHDTASGEAAADAAKQTAEALPSASTGGTGGGGGGDAGNAGPTLREQEAMADSERANVLREFGGNMMSAALGLPVGGGPAGSGPSALNPALMESAVGGAAAATRSGAAGSSFASGVSAGMAVTSSGGSTPAPAAGPSTTENKTVNIVNNFQQPPPDPHTFVQGMEFEAAGTF